MFRFLAAALVLPLLTVAAVAQAPAAPGGRTVTATGVTKPPGRAGNAPFSRSTTEADMAKAQRAAATRDKAWDSKMRTTMGSICKGC
jgi:hypothetical protein